MTADFGAIQVLVQSVKVDINAALVASPVSFAQAPAGVVVPWTGPASEASPMFQRHQAMMDMVQGDEPDA